MPVTISIAYHSGYGHTKVLAEAVRDGIESVNGAFAQTIDVTSMTDHDWEILDKSDAIIFGSPTYMGAVSGPFKTFMDQTSKVWMNRGWQDKLAAGFTVSSSQAGDKFATLSQLSTLAAQHRPAAGQQFLNGVDQRRQSHWRIDRSDGPGKCRRGWGHRPAASGP